MNLVLEHHHIITPAISLCYTECGQEQSICLHLVIEKILHPARVNCCTKNQNDEQKPRIIKNEAPKSIL
jgi:hypothetical protein